MSVLIPYNYKPYPFQVDLLKARDRGCLLMLTRWHRRAGKDKTFWNMTIKEALKRKGQYYYLFPEYKQGRRVIWDGMDNDGFSFLDHIPPEARGGIPNQQEMKIKLSNGSIIQIIGTDDYDKIRGSNPVGMVFSEYAYQNPAAYDVASPILLRNGGWAAFNSTPFGKNHFYDMENMLKTDPDAFVQVRTIADTFDWDGNPLLAESDLDRERRRGKSEDFLQQEYYCLVPGTLITTSRGQVPIEEITTKDYVLTHTNRFRKVKTIISRDIQQNIVNIKSSSSQDRIKITDNHPVLVKRNNKVSFIAAGEIKKKDQLVLPKLWNNEYKGKKVISNGLLKLLAWYITEGSLSATAIQYTVSKEEIDVAKMLVNIAEKEYNAKSSINIYDNVIQVIIRSVDLSEFLVQNAGELSHNKTIPFSLIRGQEQEFLDLLIQGDGTWSNGRYCYTSVSPSLAYGVQQLANSLGYKAKVYIRKSKTETIEGRVVNSRKRYQVWWKDDGTGDLEKDRYRLYDTVREVILEDYSGKVYNIETDKDHTYVANGRIVHNCDYTANAEGFYYLKQIEDLRQSNRIGDFPWVPDYPVFTYWDIGVGDSTAIWFVQAYDDTIWIIDYYKNNSVGIDHYAKVLMDKPYAYVKHVFPHDMINTEFGTGRTRLEMAENIFGREKVDMGPKMGFEDGIQAARALLPRCKFNEEKCKDGIKALENYHRKWDDTRQEFLQQPVHDWSSHPADAFRYLAISFEAPKPKKRIQEKLRRYRKKYGKKSWMAA